MKNIERKYIVILRIKMREKFRMYYKVIKFWV